MKIFAGRSRCSGFMRIGHIGVQLHPSIVGIATATNGRRLETAQTCAVFDPAGVRGRLRPRHLDEITHRSQTWRKPSSRTPRPGGSATGDGWGSPNRLRNGCAREERAALLALLDLPPSERGGTSPARVLSFGSF